MEFMAAKAHARFSKRAVLQQGRLAIPEMQTALGKACRERQQPGHRVHMPIGIGQRLAQHHVAAALAVNRRTGSRGASQPREKPFSGGEPTGM